MDQGFAPKHSKIVAPGKPDDTITVDQFICEEAAQRFLAGLEAVKSRTHETSAYDVMIGIQRVLGEKLSGPFVGRSLCAAISMAPIARARRARKMGPDTIVFGTPF